MAEFYRASAYARFPQEYRTGGTLGVRIMFVRQGAIEITDSAVAEITFQAARAGTGRGEVDFGDGWVAHDMVPGVVDPQPAFTECHFRIPAVDLLGLSIDHATLAARLDEVGVAMTVFDALYATVQPMPRALAAIEAAWDAAGRGGPAAQLAVDGAVGTLLGLMLDRAGRRPPPPPRLDDLRLQRAVEYAEAHLGEAVTVGDLAAAASVSLFHFSRMFKAATGSTPLAYVTARRVARAQGLLAGGLPLAQVAYASQSHFGQVFRAHVGVTPGAWWAEARA